MSAWYEQWEYWYIMAIPVLFCLFVFAAMTGSNQDMELFSVVTGLLLLYFLPSVAANNRGIESLGGLFILNLMLGWTIVGWVGALVWAFAATPKSKQNMPENKGSQLSKKVKTSAIEHLNKRLASGEISEAEYVRKKKLIVMK